MRVLVVSNLFPPAAIGGYEIGASWLCRELARRGHTVTVCSASRYLWAHTTHVDDVPCVAPGDLPWIDAGTAMFGFDLPRLLDGGYAPVFDDARLGAHEALIGSPPKRVALRDAARAAAPDAVLLFNPAGLLLPVLHEIQDALPDPVRTVAYVSDDWPLRWPAAHPLAELLSPRCAAERPSLAPLIALLHESGLQEGIRAPILDDVLFCSEFLRRTVGEAAVGGVPTRVVHWGLPAVSSRPAAPATAWDSDAALDLAFCGQVLHHKGLAQLLQALPHTRRPHRLVVIGDQTSDYGVLCQRLVEAHGLDDRVRFAGKLDPEATWQALHAQAQVLVVPSLQLAGSFEEPFSIAVLQGMALGCVVLASATDGTPEAIDDGRTGQLCDVTDPITLAGAIDAIDQDRGLAARISAAARARAADAFTIEHMTDLDQARLAGSADAADRRVRVTVTMLVRDATRDPANSGCVRVVRQVARELAERSDVDLRVRVWDPASVALRTLAPAEAEMLGR
ncbi:MAG: glycosyltransferase family 4 protein, partial [Acidobacteria bacterium]|nr:glycosyltransferase family 4 protein [Acidobacteriota bacterium]